MVRMLAVAYVTGRDSRARHVKGDDHGRKGISWFCRLGGELEAKNSTRKIIVTKP